MTQIVTAGTDELLLDTGLDELSFGKSNFVSGIQEHGCIATMNGSLESYRFSKTAVHNGHVLLCGPAFSGATLLSLFDTNPAKAKSAVYALCSILAQAEEKKTLFRIPGAGGIIVSSDSTDIKLLFLPSGLFESAALNAGKKEYAELCGWWQYKGLDTENALRFTRAAYVYRALAGTVPFAESDSEKRQNDAYDGNFIPLAYKVNGISTELASAVDRGLAIQKTAGKQPVSPAAISLPVLKQELGITDTFTVSEPQRPGALAQADFEKRVHEFTQKQQTIIHRRRFVHTHSTLLFAAAAAVIIAIIAGFNIHKAHGERPVSTGLTSKETVLAFYTGINTQDTEQMDAVASGKGARNYIASVSGVYVTGKMRQAYESVSGPVTPDIWFFAKDCAKQPVYGITRLELDGKEYSLNVTTHLRKEKPVPVIAEGTPLKNGDTKSYSVTYYVLYSMGSGLALQQYKDSLTLTYKKDRWIISDIQGENVSVPLDQDRFLKDIASAKASCSGDIPAAVSLLRNTYPWVPSDSTMQEAVQKKAAVK